MKVKSLDSKARLPDRYSPKKPSAPLSTEFIKLLVAQASSTLDLPLGEESCSLSNLELLSKICQRL